MRVRESNIMYSTRYAWVLLDDAHYTVYMVAGTHSVSDCSFPRNVDGLSLAICRADWYAHKHVPHLPLLPTGVALSMAAWLHR